MKFSLIMAAAAALLVTGAAHAGSIPRVKYQFAASDSDSDVGMAFSYTSIGFITDNRSVQPRDLDSCTVFRPIGGVCTDQSFYVDFGGFDAIIYGTKSQGGVFNFQPGAFLQSGVYSSVSDTYTSFATLHVSELAGAVPEPASWALMIVGFGIVGVAARRRLPIAVSHAV